MSKFAWVTLATNDSYSLGALVLAYSLKRVSTAHQLAILITPTVSESMRNKLKDVFNVVQEVNVLDSQDAANLALLARPELGITFTKIHCWRLVQFEKCVFLDADTMVLQNCDELFEREELSAAPDVGWPDCFNSGVFVFKPSLDTFTKITQFALEKGSFDGGDQGLLNLYFSDWATSDISKHLPFVYNTCSTATYSYLPAFKQFADRIKILHFIGQMKPWLLNFNSQTKTVYAPEGYGHLSLFLQFWWNLFCDNVHEKLTEDMQNYSSREIDNYKASHQYTRIERDDFHTEILFNVTIRDPWEDYYENLERQNDVLNPVNIPENNNNNNYNNQIVNNDIISSTDNVSNERQHFDDNNSNKNNFIESVHEPPTNYESTSEHQHQQQHENVNNNSDSRVISDHKHETQNFASENVHINSNNNFINTEARNNSETLAEHTQEGGLAGALSKLRLGEARSPEQDAYEQHIRRQCWESGNIDYAGRDSFENIWRKISETLSTAPKPAETPKDPGSRLTSADIQDGKVEFDRATGIKKTYNKIDKGYTITSEIPQPNGTMKTEVQTFYDPQPLTQEELEAANKPEGTYKKGNVTTVVKKIPGGKQLTITTVNKDGTQTVQTQTVYEAEEEEITETTESESVSPKKTTKIVSKKVPGGTAFDPNSDTKMVSHQDSTTTEEVNVKSKRTVEQTRRVTETTEISGKSTKTTKKQAIEQQNVQAIEDKPKKSKAKKCPLPPDFVEKPGEKTTLEKRKVAGGTEYIFTTIMADGRTQVSRKTVEEEEGVDMTEEEIEQYHRQLQEAEKYKNVKKTKKIQTETGTKTVVPSENPGDVTTMETIKIEGGTEYHYTTVHPDGTMKKSTKTVYDPTPVEGSDEEYEEIEEYEEEIIEPGEPIIETIERVVTISSEEKKKLEQVVSSSKEEKATKKKGKKSAAK